MSSTQTARCPVLATEQTILTDDNINSLKLNTYETRNGTVVSISCYSSSYQIQGSSQVTCINGSWIPQPPVCVLKPRLSPTTTAVYGTKAAGGSDPSPDSYNTIIIITSCILAAVVIFLLTLIVYKCYTARSRSSSKSYELPTSTRSTLPLYTTAGGSQVIPSHFPGASQSWTYLSVDRLIRDIEKSRKENPRHSWRDFTTVSAYSTKRM